MKDPPSLSRVQGISDAKLREDRTLRQLADAIEKFAPHADSVSAANDLYSDFCLASLVARQNRKEGKSSLTSVAKQLKHIGSGSATLAKRLKDADKNVFDAWAFASEDDSTPDTYEAAKQDWLQLKVLLDETQTRAIRAAKTAEKILKALNQTGEKGRPADWMTDCMTEIAGGLYREITGKPAPRRVSRITGTAEGKFHVFLKDVFSALGLKASPDEANKRLQAKLKQLGD